MGWRLGADVVNDIRNRLPWYRRDWVEGWLSGYRILAPAVYIFLASAIPALAFGEALALATDGQYTAVQVLIATALTGVLQSVVGGQPLLIVGVAEPIVLIFTYMYDFAEDREGINGRMFVAWCGWVCVWTGAMCCTLALLGSCRFIDRFTRFSGELFGMLIAVLFLQQAIKGLIKEFQNTTIIPGVTPSITSQAQEFPWTLVNGLWALLLAFGLLLTSTLLVTARSWPFFWSGIRGMLADYGPAFMVLAWSLASYIIEAPQGIPKTLSMPNTWSEEGTQNWTVTRDMGSVPTEYAAGAAIPALIITVLFYFDHNVSSRMAQAKEFNLKAPSAYHYDFMLLGLMTVACGCIGVPPVNGVLPQAPLHTRKLALLKAELNKKRDKKAEKVAKLAQKSHGTVDPTPSITDFIPVDPTSQPVITRSSPPMVVQMTAPSKTSQHTVHNIVPQPEGMMLYTENIAPQPGNNNNNSNNGRLGTPGIPLPAHAMESTQSLVAESCNSASSLGPNGIAHNPPDDSGLELLQDGVSIATRPFEQYVVASQENGMECTTKQYSGNEAGTAGLCEVRRGHGPPPGPRLGPRADGGPVAAVEVAGPMGAELSTLKDAGVHIVVQEGSTVDSDQGMAPDDGQLLGNNGAAAESKQPEVLPLEVKEQRVSGFLQASLVAACLGATPVLRKIPSAVIWGYFAFMAVESLDGQFYNRLLLLFTDKRSRAKLLQREHEVYLETVPYKWVVGFTMLQLVCLAAIYGLTWAGIAGVLFPVPIMGLVLLRQYFMPRIIPPKYLHELDAFEEEITDPLPPSEARQEAERQGWGSAASSSSAAAASAARLQEVADEERLHWRYQVPHHISHSSIQHRRQSINSSVDAAV